jgi:peptidoglycan/xylan/chitin deacetylase (PgdA/CDA1 family)
MAELRRWAERLERDSDHREARAAARAILLLVDEVGRLTGELASESEQPRPRATRDDEDDDWPDEPPASGAGLRDLLHRVLGTSRAQPDDDADLTPAQRRRRLEHRGRRRRGIRRLAILIAGLGALVFATFSLGAALAAPDLHAQGPLANAKVGPKQLPKLAFSIRAGHSEVTHASWKLDGVDVSSQALVVGDTAVLRGTSVPDGDHRLTVHVSGGFPGAESSHGWSFVVDTTPPEIGIARQVSIESGQPIRLAGTVDAGSKLLLKGRPVVARNGRFSVLLRARPLGPLLFRARDAVGNASSKRVWVSIVPRQPPAPVHAVHVTFYGWATPSLREPVLKLIAEHRIDTVELDLKDEAGIVGWDAPVPLARNIGAVQKIYDLAGAVKQLHAKSVRVIGRLVAFRDPILAKAAWTTGKRDEVIQTPDGSQYLGSGYGGFTNFSNPVVRKYNVDIAVAAAKLGVDEILYDYVRRPDGPLSSMVFPKLKGSAEASIASFLGLAQKGLAPYKTFLGASVFGVAATRPEEVAQNIPLMAQHLDYVAPMVYPSHWGPGEYGVSNPNAEPYQIVVRSLKDFTTDVQGTGARVVPWLQDFTLGVTYGTNEVKAQIDAAAADGIPEFLLWSPAVVYHSDALEPMSTKTVKPVKPPAVKANELGFVPVLMYHQILPDGGGDYDLTPNEFRAELERLWRDGYVPITGRDLIEGTIDIPAGKSPVVLTFDDSTNNQLAFTPKGALKPDTAVGILMDFARTHQGFTPTGTFFVLREPFTGGGKAPDDALRWLVAHGFELGDHTKDHKPLRFLDDTQVQQELVLGARIIHGVTPNAKIVSMALPLGSYPRTASLAVHGSWGGESYRFGGVFLVGANPSPSPFSSHFDPANIPRIRTSTKAGVRDFGSTYWLDYLDQHPDERYVSDGDPRTIAFPSAEQANLASRYRTQARPY